MFFRGPTTFICYKRNSVRANKKKQFEETMNSHLLIPLVAASLDRGLNVSHSYILHSGTHGRWSLRPSIKNDPQEVTRKAWISDHERRNITAWDRFISIG